MPFIVKSWLDRSDSTVVASHRGRVGRALPWPV